MGPRFGPGGASQGLGRGMAARTDMDNNSADERQNAAAKARYDAMLEAQKAEGRFRSARRGRADMPAMPRMPATARTMMSSCRGMMRPWRPARRCARSRRCARVR
jgi:hypothetical protein